MNIARTYYVADEDTIEWLKDILNRCGRDNDLDKQGDEWLVKNKHGVIVDKDTDFNALFWRAYDWEEDVPGYEGLLWQSPARMSGKVCIKGTRIPADMIAITVREEDGESVYEEYDVIMDQVEACLRWYFSTQEKPN